MRKNIILLLIGLAFAIAAFIFSYSRLPTLQRIINPKVTLESKHSGYELSWKNYASILQLLNDKNVFKKGIYDNTKNQYQKVRNVRIVLVNEPLDRFIGFWKYSDQDVNAISGNYNFEGENFVIHIYIIDNSDGLGDKALRDKFFTRQLTQLILHATADFVIDVEPVGFDEKRKFISGKEEFVPDSSTKVRAFDPDSIDEVLNTYFRDQSPINIKEI